MTRHQKRRLKMTQKLWTIGAALGALGLALVAVIFFYLVPAMADASLQPAPKVEWDHPLHWLGMDDILTGTKLPITTAGKPVAHSIG
jgi:hypothetical protein